MASPPSRVGAADHYGHIPSDDRHWANPHFVPSFQRQKTVRILAYHNLQAL
jgi:hypothetical protein